MIPEKQDWTSYLHIISFEFEVIFLVAVIHIVNLVNLVDVHLKLSIG